MATKRDYYDVLGVSRTASDKEIKAAYRKLARKHHPDVNPGDKSAEERFKELSEAFAVLSDPEKRATYDRGGHEAFGPGFDPFAGTGFDVRNVGFGDLSDLFDLFGAGSRRRRPPRPGRGQDIEREISIPFLEAVQGTTVEVVLPRQASCAACGGSGRRAAGGERACPDCGGTGRRTQRRRGVQVSLTCGTCGGAGRIDSGSCPTCGGTGRAPAEERLKVRVPAGIEDGGRVRLPGKGDAGVAGGRPGDAFLRFRVEPHAVFHREGNDLLCDVAVGLARAALGGRIEIPTLDGHTTITLPPGTRSGQKLRLKGKGVPAAGQRPAGDLYAVVQIVPPKRLDSRSRELLEELARLES
jgi:molecular chaperone DnaJ